jgi:signal transduction histidine kinase
MNLAESETTTGDTRTSMNLHSDTRLHGRWLQALRVIWIALALTIVVLNVLVLPGVPASLLTPEVMRELHSLDFSPAFYTALIIGMNGVCMLLYLAMSALLFWRQSAHRMALFCSLMLLTFGGAVFGFLEYVPSTTLAWNLVASGLFFLGQVCFLTFFYLFPSGRFVPRWTRWAALLYALYWLVSLSFSAFASVPPGSLLLVFLLTAVIAQVYRYRSVSTPGERQQTRWVVFGFVLAILLFIFAQLIPFLLPPDLKNSQVGASLVGGGSIYLALLLIPIFIGIAILRSQLFDIDLIIKRTLVYGILTTCVIGIYVLVVGYFGALFHSSGNLLISLIAAGLVAVAFQPLRDLLQRGINRLLYGLRDEPYVVLAGLGQRLKTTLEPDAILSTIVETVREALKLSYAAIEVKEGSMLALAASAGTPPAKEVLRLPLVYQGEPVGTLILAPRGRDNALTSADLHLLEDLAYQIGSAVHTVRLNADLQALTGDLQRSREHLVTTREEERRRLRRDLHDGLGPMLSAIMLNVGLVRSIYRREPESADALLNQLEEEIESVIGDIRRVVYNLRPPALDELGFVGAIREYVARFGSEEQAHNAALKITIEAPEVLPPLPAAVEVAAYRIVQEAVTNVIRHAHAHSCCIRFRVEDALQIEVSDDGKGIEEADRAGVGLTSMRERAEELGGTFAIKKAVPRGTQITACLPLSEAVRASSRL